MRPYLTYSEPIVTSYFGEREHPLLGTTVLHSGIDILAMAGYPARAAADGQVVYTGYRTQWGYFAVLKHSGCATVYAHLLRLPQKQEYTQGEVFCIYRSIRFCYWSPFALRGKDWWQTNGPKAVHWYQIMGGMHVGFEEKMQEIKGYLRRIELLGNAMGVLNWDRLLWQLQEDTGLYLQCQRP